MSEGKGQEGKRRASQEEASQENEQREQQSSPEEERQESEEESTRWLRFVDNIMAPFPPEVREVHLTKLVTEVMSQLSPEGRRTVAAEAMRVLQSELGEDVRDAFVQALGLAAQGVQDYYADSTSAQPTEASTTRRLSVVFSKAAYDAVQKLAKSSDKTASEYVREALALQKWFDNKRAAGWGLLSEK
jgi:hypothetical protein